MPTILQRCAPPLVSPSASPPRRQSFDRDRSSPRTSISSEPTTSSGRSRTASTRYATSPELENCAEFSTREIGFVGARVRRSLPQETAAPRAEAQAAFGDERSGDIPVRSSTTTSAEVPDLPTTLPSPSPSLPNPRNLSRPPGQFKSDHPIVAEVLALPRDNALHVVAVDHEYQAKADKWTPLFSLGVYESLVERSPLQKTAKTEHLFSGELMSYWDAVEGSGPGGKGGWETYRRFDRLESKAVEEKWRLRHEPSREIGYVYRCLLSRREKRRWELLVVDQLWTDYLAWEHANGIEDEARIRARLGRFPLSDFPTLLQRNQAEREALWEQAEGRR